MSRTYVTSKKLIELERSLTPREHLVLATLTRVRLASAVHLERLHFGDVTRRQARQVLARMVTRRLLLRLPRTVGGVRAGSGGYVYGLDTAGARLATPGNRRHQPWNVGSAFLAHTLSITELYVRLVEAHRLGTLKLGTFTAEPGCWRSFAAPGGGRATLKPDAYVTVDVDRYEDLWFIEVDRSTEATPTLRRKCDTYRRYWQTGTEQARSGIFPRVLWLVPNEHRQAVLIDVFGRMPVESWPLFTVALTDEAVTRFIRGAHE
jgi:hypothetical protein